MVIDVFFCRYPWVYSVEQGSFTVFVLISTVFHGNFGNIFSVYFFLFPLTKYDFSVIIVTEYLQNEHCLSP